MPVEDEGGFVVRRLGDGMEWVRERERALFYPGAPEFGGAQANADSRRLRTEGYDCYTLHWSRKSRGTAG